MISTIMLMCSVSYEKKKKERCEGTWKMLFFIKTSIVLSRSFALFFPFLFSANFKMMMEKHEKTIYGDQEVVLFCRFKQK